MEVKFDFAPLIALNDNLAQTPIALSQAAVSIVNIVADKAFRESKELTLAKVNLPNARVDEHYKIEEATNETGFATITASGRGVSLVNFNPRVSIARASAKAKGRKLGAVPPGGKQVGLTVDVRSVGSAGFLAHGFLLNVKSGIGVFTRSTTGKIKKRYGPSEDQVFNNIIPEITPQILADLETQALKTLDNLKV